METETRRSFIALLHAASYGGVTLNRTKIAKLLYLADLRAVEQGEHVFTGFTWRWRHHGPYDNALLEVERSLKAEGTLDSTITNNYFGSPEWVITPKTLPDMDLDKAFWEIIQGVCVDYGGLSASSLRDITYQTPPMQEAVSDDAHEQLLDFTDVRPAPEIASVLQRLRDVVLEAGQQEDDPDVTDEIAQDLETFRPMRAAANRELLD